MAPRSRVASLAVLVLLGCQHSESRFAGRSISASELLGTWQATDFSLQCLAKLPTVGHLTKRENLITLRRDGKCSARGYLNPSENPGGANATNAYEIIDECTWELRRGRHDELTIRDRSRIAATFFFDDSGNKLVLWQYVTDPDAWQYVEFEKLAGEMNVKHGE
jgi:hypothetical protein